MNGHQTSGKAPSTWEELGSLLAGSFSARARGLVAIEFALQRRGGAEFGRLTARGGAGAELGCGDLRATIERSGATGKVRYRMLSGGAEVLLAGGERFAAGAGLRLSCRDRRYSARVSLLRNRASVRSPEGAEVVRVWGGLLGRGYEIVLDPEDPGALPVAFLLLYHLAFSRSRAYLTAPGEDKS